MKKNINVNIFGVLYPMDEDAYELLKKYNENMRRYYAGKDGGDEIADDIEHRVAELLSELMAQGTQAITIDHVQDIIRRIGDPNEFDDNDMSGADEECASGEQHGSVRAHDSSRKLYRDPNDKILGGVISGICHYFGINDPLIPRLLFVVLLFVSFSTLAVVYIILWVLIPEATSPEERLRMYGKPVTPKSISEELMRGVDTARQFVNTNQSRARSCLSSLLKLLVATMAVIALLILALLLFSLIIVIASFVFNLPYVDNEVLTMFASLPKRLPAGLFTSIFFIILVPAYSILRWLTKKPDSPSMAPAAKLVLLATWIVALSVLIVSSVSMYNKIQQNYDDSPSKFLSDDSVEMLHKLRMKATTLSGCDNHIDGWSILPDGSAEGYGSRVIYICENDESKHDFMFDVNRTITIDEPGKYSVEGLVHADGQGAVVYAMVNDTLSLYKYQVPEYKVTNIKSLAPDSISRIEFFNIGNNTDSLTIANVLSTAADHEWDYYSMDFDVNEPGTLRIGYSNCDQYSAGIKNVRQFRASEIKLIRRN